MMRWETYVDDLVSVPLLGVELDDSTFGQEGDFDRMDAGLRPEHALDGLKEVKKGGI
jgi:hypothetical protein